jgi:hypothetical protein
LRHCSHPRDASKELSSALGWSSLERTLASVLSFSGESPDLEDPTSESRLPRVRREGEGIFAVVRLYVQ